MQNNKPNFIVALSSVSFPYGNASDNAIYTFMDGFREHGCEGEVLCLYSNLSKVYFAVEPVGEYLGVKYRYILNRTYNSENKFVNHINFKFRIKFLLKSYLKNKLKSYRVHVVFFTHVDERFEEYSQLCHNLGIPISFTACEYPEYLINNTPDRTARFRDMSRFIDKYIFETKTLQIYYENILGKISSMIVPATMPFEDILNAEKKSIKPYIAYCGSIHSEAKDGLSNIIDAFSLFHEENNAIDLKFIGRISNQGYFESLVQKVKNLGIEDCVSFSGEVDREEYVQYIADASLMIVAKPNDSYYGGGLSSKVIEYLFSGNPVLMVAADDYINYLTHKENVYFVQDNSPESLCKGIRYMFTDDEFRNRIGQNGKTYALECFNYHKLTKSLLKYITE